MLGLRTRPLAAAWITAFALTGCGGCGDDTSTSASANAGGGSASNGSASNGSASNGSGGSGAQPIASSSGNGSGNGSASGGGAACSATTAETELEPVHLFFVLDESGSMGDGEHGDITKKWNPVVASLKAFFADPASEGLQASMTLFPPNYNTGTGPAKPEFQKPEQCVAATYDTADVPLTPLPDAAVFAAKLDAITPPNEQGTPTRAAAEGAVAQVDAFLGANPGAKAAVVFVSDGEPAGCSGGENTIANTAASLEAAAPRFPTYVVGVGKSLTSLNQLAAAGGTGQAFLVEVGDPEKTKAEFLAAVNQVRTSLLPCEVEIPPPPAGETLDPAKVNVDIVSSEGRTPLEYDQACADGTGWRYDDAAKPTKIEFCAATCSAVQAKPGAKVELAFGCEQRTETPT